MRHDTVFNGIAGGEDAAAVTLVSAPGEGDDRNPEIVSVTLCLINPGSYTNRTATPLLIP